MAQCTETIVFELDYLVTKQYGYFSTWTSTSATGCVKLIDVIASVAKQSNK